MALIGFAVVGVAALFIEGFTRFGSRSQSSFRLQLRVGIGFDLEKIVGPILEVHFQERQLASLCTTQKGAALDVVYQGRFRGSGNSVALVKSLNLTEGIQSVQLDRLGLGED